jgi:hypothetical protein
VCLRVRALVAPFFSARADAAGQAEADALVAAYARGVETPPAEAVQLAMHVPREGAAVPWDLLEDPRGFLEDPLEEGGASDEDDGNEQAGDDELLTPSLTVPALPTEPSSSNPVSSIRKGSYTSVLEDPHEDAEDSADEAEVEAFVVPALLTSSSLAEEARSKPARRLPLYPPALPLGRDLSYATLCPDSDEETDDDDDA